MASSAAQPTLWTHSHSPGIKRTRRSFARWLCCDEATGLGARACICVIFLPLLIIERQFTPFLWRPLMRGDSVVTGRAAPPGRGRPGPARFSCPWGRQRLSVKAGLGVYLCQAAGRPAVAPRSQPALTLRGGPVPSRGAAPSLRAAALP